MKLKYVKVELKVFVDGSVKNSFDEPNYKT